MNLVCLVGNVGVASWKQVLFMGHCVCHQFQIQQNANRQTLPPEHHICEVADTRGSSPVTPITSLQGVPVVKGHGVWGCKIKCCYQMCSCFLWNKL